MGVATGRRGYYNPIWQTGDIVAPPPPPPPPLVLTFFLSCNKVILRILVLLF